MAKKEKQPQQLTPEQLQEIAKQNLNQMHMGAFARYLEAQFPQGTKGMPQEQMDLLFSAFCCGFNSGIFQAAGETLMMVGVNLNELTVKAQGK